MYNTNFHYSQNPFGLFNHSSFRQSPKRIWKIFLAFVAILGIVLLFIFRDVILNFFIGKSIKSENENNELPSANSVESKGLKNQDETLETLEMLSEQKIEMIFYIVDKASWNWDYIKAKEAEGKAIFVKQKGWIIYE